MYNKPREGNTFQLFKPEEAADLIRKFEALFAAHNAKRPETVTVEEPDPICPACSNMGVVSRGYPLGHLDFGKLFPCPAESCPTRYNWQRARVARLVEQTQIPTAYADYTLESFTTLEPSFLKGKYLAWGLCSSMAVYHPVPDGFTLRDAARLTNLLQEEKYDATNARRSVVLSGSYGLGKTALACGMVKALASRSIPVLYTRLDNLFADIQSRYADLYDQDPAEARLRFYSTIAVLVLDECNVSNVSEDKLRLFESIVRYRTGNCLPTLMTTNLNRDQFTQAWGQRIADPLFADAHYIELAGVRLRGSANVAKELW